MTQADRERIEKAAKEAEIRTKYSFTGNSVQLGKGGPTYYTAHDAVERMRRDQEKKG